MAAERDTGIQWRLVIPTAITVMSSFGILLYGFSVFLTDEAAGSEFSTTVLSLAFGGAALGAALLALPVGRIADHRGIRGLIGVGAVFGCGGLLAFGAADQAWQVVAAWWLLLGPAMALTFYEPAFVAIDQWCAADQRPRALAVLTVIGGLAGVLFIPGIERLVALTGWRDTTVILGVLLLVVGGGTALIALRDTAPTQHRGHHPKPSGVWFRSVARDSKFILYTAALMLSLFAAQGVLAHRIARFSEGGFVVAAIAGWAAAASALSLPGRWIAPLLAGRLRAASVQAATICLVGVATLLMVDGTESWQMVGHFVLFGLGFGALVPVRALIMANWYSGPAYGRIMGIQATAIGVAGALGPAVVGIARDRVGSYSIPMTALASIYFLAAVLVVVSGNQATRSSTTDSSPSIS